MESAAIVIEWDLPENVQGELPAGFLRTPDKRISAPRAFDALRTATKYGKQLCSMIEYISAAEQKALTERAQTVANPTAWPAQVNEASQRKEEVSGNGNANVQAGSSVGS